MRILIVMSVLSLASSFTPAAAKCRAVPGTEAVLRPGARVVFGEMHGNNETQALVGDVACAAAQLGPVRVGLEIPSDEQARVDAFLASTAAAAARKELLAGPFWNRALQDGRSSTAMLALLERLRALGKEGRDIKVVAFDVPPQAKTEGRDRAMATALTAAFAREPNATFVVLVGNLHARKAAHPQIKQRFMAQYLADDKQAVTTLDVRSAVGSSWVCTPECGPRAIGHGALSSVGITLAPTKDGAFDGTFAIGAPTFAPPAARAPTQDEQRRVALTGLEIDATRACGANQYARCAELQIEHAVKDPAGAAGYLYDAACSYARLGDANRAFTQLGGAVDKGFSDRAWMEKDEDLASLHGDARWAALLQRVATPKK